MASFNPAWLLLGLVMSSMGCYATASGHADADYVEVEDVIIAKVPEAARPNSIYWPDPEGLSRKNPTQERMFPDAPKALSDGQKGGAE